MIWKRTTYCILLALLGATDLLAQGPPGPGPPPPHPELPIDSGLLLLLGSGIVLGIYTIYQKTVKE